MRKSDFVKIAPRNRLLTRFPYLCMSPALHEAVRKNIPCGPSCGVRDGKGKCYSGQLIEGLTRNMTETEEWGHKRLARRKHPAVYTLSYHNSSILKWGLGDLTDFLVKDIQEK